jgi:hypothetical protein
VASGSVPSQTSSSHDFEVALATDSSCHDTHDLEIFGDRRMPDNDWVSPVAQAIFSADVVTTDSDGFDESLDFPAQMAPLVRFQNAAQRYQPVLAMCKSFSAFTSQIHLTTETDDKEFCMFPLTMDSPINPYRIRPNSAGRSEFLLHAILALSSQHLAKKTNQVALSLQAQDHREIAMQSFTQALCHSDPCSLLDALLILVSLDVSRWSALMNRSQLTSIAHTICVR